MACSSYVCALTSVADQEEELFRLGRALLGLDESLSRRSDRWDGSQEAEISDGVLPARRVCTLLEAEEHEKEWCLLTEAAGRVSADFVTLYPPGIPILAPGELAEQSMLRRIGTYIREGLEVNGVSRGRILVWKEDKPNG